ncbi:MAG: hypothetical protein N2645_00340 [Clostridia bacterium]|nr:hypothetical protein [Clostridia bacterium]
MSGFKLICCQCGSDKVLEKNGKNKVDWAGDRVIYGEGIQRRCLDCNNESFSIFRTWSQ